MPKITQQEILSKIKDYYDNLAPKNETNGFGIFAESDKEVFIQVNDNKNSFKAPLEIVYDDTTRSKVHSGHKFDDLDYGAILNLLKSSDEKSKKQNPFESRGFQEILENTIGKGAFDILSRSGTQEARSFFVAPSLSTLAPIMMRVEADIKDNYLPGSSSSSLYYNVTMEDIRFRNVDNTFSPIIGWAKASFLIEDGIYTLQGDAECSDENLRKLFLQELNQNDVQDLAEKGVKEASSLIDSRKQIVKDLQGVIDEFNDFDSTNIHLLAEAEIVQLIVAVGQLRKKAKTQQIQPEEIEALKQQGVKLREKIQAGVYQLLEEPFKKAKQKNQEIWSEESIQDTVAYSELALLPEGEKKFIENAHSYSQQKSEDEKNSFISGLRDNYESGAQGKSDTVIGCFDSFIENLKSFFKNLEEFDGAIIFPPEFLAAIKNAQKLNEERYERQTSDSFNELRQLFFDKEITEPLQKIKGGLFFQLEEIINELNDADYLILENYNKFKANEHKEDLRNADEFDLYKEGEFFRLARETFPFESVIVGHGQQGFIQHKGFDDFIGDFKKAEKESLSGNLLQLQSLLKIIDNLNGFYIYLNVIRGKDASISREIQNNSLKTAWKQPDLTGIDFGANDAGTKLDSRITEAEKEVEAILQQLVKEHHDQVKQGKKQIATVFHNKDVQKDAVSNYITSKIKQDRKFIRYFRFTHLRRFNINELLSTEKNYTELQALSTALGDYQENCFSLSTDERLEKIQQIAFLTENCFLEDAAPADFQETNGPLADLYEKVQAEVLYLKDKKAMPFWPEEQLKKFSKDLKDALEKKLKDELQKFKFGGKSFNFNGREFNQLSSEEQANFAIYNIYLILGTIQELGDFDQLSEQDLAAFVSLVYQLKRGWKHLTPASGAEVFPEKIPDCVKSFFVNGKATFSKDVWPKVQARAETLKKHYEDACNKQSKSPAAFRTVLEPHFKEKALNVRPTAVDLADRLINGLTARFEAQESLDEVEGVYIEAVKNLLKIKNNENYSLPEDNFAMAFDYINALAQIQRVKFGAVEKLSAFIKEDDGEISSQEAHAVVEDAQLFIDKVQPTILKIPAEYRKRAFEKIRVKEREFSSKLRKMQLEQEAQQVNKRDKYTESTSKKQRDTQAEKLQILLSTYEKELEKLSNLEAVKKEELEVLSQIASTPATNNERRNAEARVYKATNEKIYQLHENGQKIENTEGVEKNHKELIDTYNKLAKNLDTQIRNYLKEVHHINLEDAAKLQIGDLPNENIKVYLAFLMLITMQNFSEAVNNQEVTLDDYNAMIRFFVEAREHNNGTGMFSRALVTNRFANSLDKAFREALVDKKASLIDASPIDIDKLKTVKGYNPNAKFSRHLSKQLDNLKQGLRDEQSKKSVLADMWDTRYDQSGVVSPDLKTSFFTELQNICKQASEQFAQAEDLEQLLEKANYFRRKMKDEFEKEKDNQEEFPESRYAKYLYVLWYEENIRRIVIQFKNEIVKLDNTVDLEKLEKSTITLLKEEHKLLEIKERARPKHHQYKSSAFEFAKAELSQAVQDKKQKLSQKQELSEEKDAAKENVKDNILLTFEERIHVELHKQLKVISETSEINSKKVKEAKQAIESLVSEYNVYSLYLGQLQLNENGYLKSAEDKNKLFLYDNSGELEYRVYDRKEDILKPPLSIKESEIGKDNFEEITTALKGNEKTLKPELIDALFNVTAKKGYVHINQIPEMMALRKSAIDAIDTAAKRQTRLIYEGQIIKARIEKICKDAKDVNTAEQAIKEIERIHIGEAVGVLGEKGNAIKKLEKKKEQLSVNQIPREDSQDSQDSQEVEKKSPKIGNNRHGFFDAKEINFGTNSGSGSDPESDPENEISLKKKHTDTGATQKQKIEFGSK